MPRPFTDVASAKTSEPLKNGSIVTGAFPTGRFNTIPAGTDLYTNASGSGLTFSYNPNIYSYPGSGVLSNKYGNRFYNGLFVKSIASGVIAGSGL